jgi:hypothetical protein
MGRNRNPKYDDAYALYLDGLSLEQVAKHLNVSRQCLYQAFKKRGLSLRGVNFRPYKFYDGKKFTLRNNGYYGLSNNDRCLMHRYVWENHNGKIPMGYDIHHIDNNKANNDINNLMCLPKSEHTRLFSPHNNQYTKGRKIATH